VDGEAREFTIGGLVEAVLELCGRSRPPGGA
jgi:hypothetical protein